MSTTRSELFELELSLPEAGLHARAGRLVGFEARYERIRRDLRLLAAPEEVGEWSRKFYGSEMPICAAVTDRYPLVIFAGDVGTGKTETAEAMSDRLARETGKGAMLFKLSTRVRGGGKVGEMSTLLNNAFETVVKEAGKTRSAFLIIDEADSLTSTRDESHRHHEDKVAVNTIIQRVDDLRRHRGRVLVFLCTNRSAALDPAVVRRAARTEVFSRPNAEERLELLRMDLKGLGIEDAAIRQLVDMTGPSSDPPQPGFTFSDLRSRLLPEALARAFPSRRIQAEDFVQVAREMTPSPAVYA
ncbi:MAG TPA: ATP-binding protein [Longimicrobium sp.]|uniref:ATP-binding protein n=1 Tax=Longimicrobium sp. TaxID=2029185 RepID=UPI002ED7D336